MGMPPPQLHGMLMRGRAEDQGAWGWHLLGSVFSASLIKVTRPCPFKSRIRWKRARVQAEANTAALEGVSLATLRSSNSPDIRCAGGDQEGIGNVCKEPYARMFTLSVIIKTLGLT